MELNISPLTHRLLCYLAMLVIILVGAFQIYSKINETGKAFFGSIGKASSTQAPTPTPR